MFYVMMSLRIYCFLVVFTDLVGGSWQWQVAGPPLSREGLLAFSYKGTAYSKEQVKRFIYARFNIINIDIACDGC